MTRTVNHDRKVPFRDNGQRGPGGGADAGLAGVTNAYGQAPFDMVAPSSKKSSKPLDLSTTVSVRSDDVRPDTYAALCAVDLLSLTSTVCPHLSAPRQETQKPTCTYNL